MTDQYAVAGFPVEHSLSPDIHHAFAQQTGQSLTYSRISLHADDFVEGVKKFFAQGGKGLNITVPYKELAFQIAGQVSERAELAGAVNTLLIKSDGVLFGDNTDGCGLARDLTQNLKLDLRGIRILILGAGGAVRGVLGELLKLQPAQIVVANRTREKAEALASRFSALGNISASGFDGFDDQAFDLVINGTSASLAGQRLPLPDRVVTGQSVAYDMMYGKDKTPFMYWAAEQRVSHIYDGLGMLVEQAAEAFFNWRGIRPDTQPVLGQLRQQLK